MGWVRNKIFRILDGMFANDRKGGTGPKYFEELLDESARQSCCGIDCCRQVIYLRDHATQEIMEAWIENGAWVFQPKAVAGPCAQ